MAYVYQCEHWCDSCGEKIKLDLDAKGIDDNSDSDNYPQWFDQDNEETDSPCHCAGQEDCLEAAFLSYNKNATIKFIPVIVCQNLTSDGTKYVLEQHSNKPTKLTEYWLSFYGIDDPNKTDDDD